jgi:acetoin utilization deacetylase AcuC-like enzyme
MAKRALLLDDERFDAHAPVAYHPERPERLVAARTAVASLEKAGIAWERRTAREATATELALVHDPAYVERLERLRGEESYLDPDTYVVPGSIGAARLAAGGVVDLVDAMLDGPVKQGVALLRPPGHHARPAQAMGFCLVNNVAVAAAHARARGLGRVAVVDWDVHHGNGTQEMFWRDPTVLYVSTHQWPFYPGTGAAKEIGEGEGQGFTLNVPLSAGGGDPVYRSAFERVILPVLAEYKPELVLVSAGFDPAIHDPLSQMDVSDGGFAWMARALARVADAHAEGRIALVLEGGYDLPSLEGGLAAAAGAMLGGDAPEPGVATDDPDVARAERWAKRAGHAIG